MIPHVDVRHIVYEVFNVLRLSADFVLRKIFHVSLLIPIRRNKVGNDVLYINDTVACVIETCDGSKNKDELVEFVVNKFNDDNKNEIRKDIEKLLLMLQEMGLIEED